MKFTRNASAHWAGSGKEGNGTISTQSTVLDNTQFSFKTRFADGIGTNPEELIGAAHAGCFTMKLSFVIGEMGFTPTTLDTTAKVTLADGKISNIHLEVRGNIAGMSAAQFAEATQNAKENCPISKLFNTEITLDAQLLA